MTKKKRRYDNAPLYVTSKIWAYREKNRLELYTDESGLFASFNRRELLRILSYLPSRAQAMKMRSKGTGDAAGTPREEEK
jgi:hypothetical protein